MTRKAPLILTLKLDTKSQEFFTILRDRYFPPERNYLKAHLTLFHQLPTEESFIVADLKSCQNQPWFKLKVEEPYLLGNGVAYRISSNDLLNLHGHLQSRWRSFLTAQDKQKLRPHITVQNKVDGNTAAVVINELRRSFTSFDAYATGLSLWEYLGGPWEHLEDFDFDKVDP